MVVNVAVNVDDLGKTITDLYSLKENITTYVNNISTVIENIQLGWVGQDASTYVESIMTFKNAHLGVITEYIDGLAKAVEISKNIVSETQDQIQTAIRNLGSDDVSTVAGGIIKPRRITIANPNSTLGNSQTSVSAKTVVPLAASGNNQTLSELKSNSSSSDKQINYIYGPGEKGNQIIKGSDSITVNDMINKIKVECENQGIGDNWKDAVAISLWETGNYQGSGWNASSNNFGGLSPNGTDRLGFLDVDSGISAFVSNLKKNYILQGLTDISSIGPKYCPGTSESWTANVSQMKSQLESSIDS